MLTGLARKSLLNRKSSVALTLASLTLSIIIVLGVEHIRSQAQESFNRTVSGVDLIVGARTSQLNLLLYSVFRIGNATNNISWDSYRLVAGDDRVAWTIPLSLGDSHRGYRVLGTNQDYFAHYRFGDQQNLGFASGEVFATPTQAVIGSELADELEYRVGQEIVLSHGLGDVSFSNHDENPFTVTGILEPTGTPVDQTVHVSLEGVEAVHGGAGADLAPSSITAFMAGLESRRSVFTVQRAINEYDGEPLLAILPGVALAELWEMMGMVENVLALISALVLLASLLGLSTMLLSSMRERQREIFLFRSIGMHASSILFLIEIEAVLITVVAAVLALLVVSGILVLGRGWLSQEYGLFIDVIPLSNTIALYLLVIVVAASVLALTPAISAYRSALGSRLRS